MYTRLHGATIQTTVMFTVNAVMI